MRASQFRPFPVPRFPHLTLGVALYLTLHLPCGPGWAQENGPAPAPSLRVLPEELAPGVPPAMMMDAWLKRLAFAALDRREAAFEALKTPEDIAAWQEKRRDFFLRQIGGLPERTPLNARTVDRLEYEDYVLEKVIFESQPSFFVTASLYLPKGEGPFPGVLHPTGHSATGKARDLYQQASIVIAKGGCAVLCYDPAGQGERRQFLDGAGQPRFKSTTQEHQLINQGSVLLGSNTARFMIWDSMRGIDYLQSRPEVDPERIGCTGISGGGTNTSYLMALDGRIQAAAPGCYLTGFRHLLTELGPQDAEQNIFGQISFGMDHADYVLMRAPKPTLIMAATQDYFPIAGAWDLFREAKRTYTRLGHPERVDLVEPDTPHGFPTEMRVAAANFFRRWLLNETATVEETPFPVLSEEEIRCTPEGQVLKLEGARSAFDLNADWNRRFAERREALWQPDQQSATLEKVRSLLHLRPFADLPPLNPEAAGNVERDGYRIEKFVIRNGGIRLPALLFVPATPAPDRTPILYLHGQGKHTGAAPGGPIEAWVKKGVTVLAVDLRGMGETEPPGGLKAYDDLLGPDWRDTTLAFLLGHSYVGMRASDILQSVRFLREQLKSPDLQPNLFASGQAAIPALHAAALEPGLFSEITLDGMIRSWTEVVETPETFNQQPNLVHGALRLYDLPDLIATLDGDRLSLTHPVSVTGEPLPD